MASVSKFKYTDHHGLHHLHPKVFEYLINREIFKTCHNALFISR